MNKICKEYISEVKALFPIKSKQEKEYLKKLSQDIEDFCEESDAISKETLYNKYGTPEDVVSNYLSTLDRENLIKHINCKKHIRIIAAGLLVAITLATLIYGVYIHRLYELKRHQEVVINEHTIQYYD